VHYLGEIRAWESKRKHLRHNGTNATFANEYLQRGNNSSYYRRNPNCLCNLCQTSMASVTAAVTTLNSVPSNFETPEQHKTEMFSKEGSNS